MAYSYRWQYCDIDFLRHCLKQYSLLLEKIPSAILTEETTGTQMFVTGYLSDCIKRCDDGFDDYTMTALLPEGTATASHFSIMRTTECWKRSFSGTIFAGTAVRSPR